MKKKGLTYKEMANVLNCKSRRIDRIFQRRLPHLKGNNKPITNQELSKVKELRTKVKTYKQISKTKKCKYDRVYDIQNTK